MNNFNYYYLPTMPNNKLSNLLSVIDSLSLSENIAIVTKNIQQSFELNNFLKNKGINNIVVQEKNDLDIYAKNKESIVIITSDSILLLKDIVISYVISIFSSTSLDELKNKANICHLNEKLILVELISKFDFQFIQGLYKFSEVIIERFSCLDNEKMLENKNLRILSFLKTNMNNSLLDEKDGVLSSDIIDFINNCNLQDIKLFFKSFFTLSVYSKIPVLDFIQSANKSIMKEIKIVLSQGYLDNIVEESLKEYFLKISGITLDSIIQCVIEEKQTTLILKLKDLSKNDISSYLLNNSYGDFTLLLESIIEKNIEEVAKFGEVSGEGYLHRRDNNDRGSYQKRNRDGDSYQKRDRDGGSGYQRRDRDGGSGYQRRDRDGGSSYQRRDRDGGSGYQRREGGYSSRPSYGGYDKFKNSNNSDTGMVSNYEGKDNESRETKSNYYGKNNYSGGSSSYGEKKSYRSFSSDFGSADMQNSGKDRSGYDNKRKDFRGGGRDRRGGSSSYGGGFKKSYDRGSSNSGYGNYGKDRYSKGGSNFQLNNEDSDNDNE